MNSRFTLRNPWVSGLLVFLLITSVLTFIPISIFDAEITFNNGLNTWTVPTKLSYAHFLNMGGSNKDMIDVERVYFTAGGYLLAFLLNIGLPILIGYRIHIANEMEKSNNQ